MNSILLTFDFRLSTHRRGFTLVELLVSMGIFTVITGVVLANYRTFNTKAFFVNASEDVVLALRQSQIYGVGVKGCGTANPFDCSYGVYFSTNASKKNEIVIFADVNSNRIYDLATDTVVERIKWNSYISVHSLSCDGSTCGSDAYVTFKRPSADAYIATTANPSASIGVLVVNLIDANTGSTAVITISHAGQISLQTI